MKSSIFRLFVSAVGLVFALQLARAASVSFTSAPSTVQSGENYYVAAGLSTQSGGDLTIWKNGGYFSGRSHWQSWFSTGTYTVDSGSQTVEFFAEGYDYLDETSDSAYAWVTVQGSAGNNPPTAWVECDTHLHGGTVVRPYGGSVQVTLRFKASDPDGNLSGIRPQIWHPGTGYFTNDGGAWTGQSGGNGEVVRTVTLNQDGDWYFWTDAEDASGASTDSGSWSSGFRLNVVQSSPPPQAPSVFLFQPGGDTTIPVGTHLTLQAYAEDFSRPLSEHNIDIQRPDGTWNWQGGFAYGEPFMGGPTGPDAPTASLRTAGFTFDQVGVWKVRSYARNNANLNSWTAERSITVTALVQSAVSISPASATITFGQSVTLNATGGNGSGAYVWGGALSGTGTSKVFTPAATGTYTVTLMRQGDSTYADSAAVTATVQVGTASQTAVSISPVSTSIGVGGSVTFTAGGGQGTGAYVWSGDASGTGTTKNVTFGTSGVRSISVYRAGDSSYASSNTATASVTVIGSPLGVIATHPQSQTAVTGSSVTFTVVPAGAGPFSYQWKKNGADLAGQTGSTLTLANLQTTDAAGYTVQVTNSAGIALSNVAWLPIATAGGTQVAASPAAKDRSPVIPGIASTIVGGSGYNIQSGSIFRVVTDFQVTGAVGAYPLNMTRTFTGENWGYSFIWWAEEKTNVQFRQNQLSPTGEQFLNVRTPDGQFLHFNAKNPDFPLDFSQSGDGVRVAVVRDANKRIAAVALHFPDGGSLMMEKSVDDGNTRKFRPVMLADPYGLSTTYSYSTAAQEIPTQVTDASGRYLQFYGTSPTTITKVASSCGKWIEWSGNTLNYWDGLSARYASGIVGTNLRWFRFSDVRATAGMRNVEFILNRFSYGVFQQLDMGEPEVWEVVRERHFADIDTSPVDGGILVSERQVHERKQLLEEGPARPTGPAIDVTEIRGDGPSRNFKFSVGGVGQPYHLLSVTDYRGNRTVLADWLNGVPAKVTDPLGRETLLQSNGWGRIARVTHPDGTYREYTWDNRYLTGERDERGNWTRYSRDVRNRITRIEYADGSDELFVYNSLNQLTEHKLRNGAREYWHYTTAAQTWRVWEPNNVGASPTAAFVEHTYYQNGASQGLIQQTRDARGNITKFEYNARGQVTKETFADNNSRVFTYDAWGNRLTVRDELGNVTSSTYDAYNRLVSVSDPLFSVTTHSYEPMSGGSPLRHVSSAIRRTTAPTGRVTAFVYDNDYRVLEEIRAQGTSDESKTISVFNSVGNLTSVTQQVTAGVMRTTTFDYDVRNRKRFEYAPLSRATEWQYNAASNVQKVIHPDGTFVSTTYNAMNQVATTTDEMGYMVAYTYTSGGLVDVTTDRKGYTYRYEYDAAGRKTRFWYPAANGSGYGTSERWTYTPTGQVSEYFNRSNQRLAYTYDNRNRETLRAWDGNAAPSVSTAYDAASRVVSRTNATGTLTYSYDAAGRITSESQAIASGPVIAVGASYDADGRRTRRSATGEADQNFGYDQRGQLNSISQSGLAFGFGYDLSGARIQRTSPNGTASSYLYDTAGRLKTINTYRVAGQSNILRQDFGYDSRDRRTWSLRDSNYGDSYSYQADSQLIGFRFNQLRPDQDPNASASAVDSYDYDPNGNRRTRSENGTVTTYSTNALNEYASVSGAAILHGDGRGNVTLWREWSYTYDAENRLVSAVRAGLTVAFHYDAQGRLAKLVRNGAPEYRFFDGTRLFLRKNDAGVVVERTIWGPSSNEALARWTPTQVDGWRYYHHDPQNSPLAITDVSGGVVERYLYDVFGLDYVYDGAWGVRADSVLGNPWRFTGQEWMADLALHNYKQRFYHNDLGRFLQQDPVRFDAGDLNLYRYCGNDAINRVDPSGLAAKKNPSALKWDSSVAMTAAQETAERKEENTATSLSAKHVEKQKSEAPNSAATPAIAYANHPVKLGFHHSKIVITPKDQAKYASDPRFENIDKDGNRYATVGGGPDKGLSKGLWGGVNRERDVSFPNNNLQGLAIPGTYKNEDAAIAALFTLVDNYNKHPVSDYDFFPSKNSDAYNSNSFVSGILNAGGFTPPPDPGASVPGYSKPVPWTYFRPRRKPKRKDARSRSRQKRSRELQILEGVA